MRLGALIGLVPLKLLSQGNLPEPPLGKEQLLVVERHPRARLPFGLVRVLDYRARPAMVGRMASIWQDRDRPLTLETPLEAWLQEHADPTRRDTLIVRISRLWLRQTTSTFAALRAEAFVKQGDSARLILEFNYVDREPIRPVGYRTVQERMTRMLHTLVRDLAAPMAAPAPMLPLGQVVRHPFAHWPQYPIVASGQPNDGLYPTLADLQANRPLVPSDGRMAAAVDSLRARNELYAIGFDGTIRLQTDAEPLPLTPESSYRWTGAAPLSKRIERQGGTTIGIGMGGFGRRGGIGFGGQIPVGGRQVEVGGPPEAVFLDWDTGQVYPLEMLPELPRN